MENYHFVKDGDQYKLKKEKAERATKVFQGNKEDAKKEAIEYLKQHGGSLKIHNNHGKISEERTYPKKDDPTTTKG